MDLAYLVTVVALFSIVGGAMGMYLCDPYRFLGYVLGTILGAAGGFLVWWLSIVAFSLVLRALSLLEDILRWRSRR